MAQPGPRLYVRGTQSFVQVMAAIWKRPWLVGLEIVWRWICCVLAILAVWIANGAPLGKRLQEFADAVVLAFHGEFIFGFNARQFARSWPWWLVLGAVWGTVSCLGHNEVLRRLDPQLRQRRSFSVLLAVFRTWWFLALLGAWMSVLVRQANIAVSVERSPQAFSVYLTSFAVVLLTTLLLFVFWAMTSWVFRLATLRAMAGDEGFWDCLRSAWRDGQLRGKLIEINLIMGVVKVALLVLALVLSASPLPFANRETQGFLACWWMGTAVLWVLASDYFHVVRSAAYVAMVRVYKSDENANSLRE